MWARDLQRQVGGRVPQGQECGLGAGPPGQLGHLAFHPHGAQPADPAADGLRDHPDRCRLLRRGLQRHHSETVPTERDRRRRRLAWRLWVHRRAGFFLPHRVATARAWIALS